jgi:hypothetical protein
MLSSESPVILLDVVSREEAAKFWQIMPTNTPDNVVPMDSWPTSWNGKHPGSL